MEDKFNEDYFENGVEKKLSGYTNYRYMPTRSYEEAIALKSRWKEGKVLDYGCAKGYLVHALRQLGFDAYGQDISRYAIDNCHPAVKDYVSFEEKWMGFQYIVCKDVMEHVPEDCVLNTLRVIKSSLMQDRTKREALFVIPLGDDGKFRIREYEMDVTHVTKKDEDWWIDKLKQAGFFIVDFKYKFGDIKKKWQGYEYGNGFFFVR